MQRYTKNFKKGTKKPRNFFLGLFYNRILISFLGYLGEHLLDEVPEGGYATDLTSLLGCVGTEQGGTHGEYVEVGVLGHDDGALQSGVYALHLAVLAVLLLVHLEHMLQYLTVGVGVPATVVAAGRHLHAGHGEAALAHGGDVGLVVLV